jgi:hypothetical protein
MEKLENIKERPINKNHLEKENLKSQMASKQAPFLKLFFSKIVFRMEMSLLFLLTKIGVDAGFKIIKKLELNRFLNQPKLNIIN